MESVFEIFSASADKFADRPFLHIPEVSSRSYADGAVDFTYAQALEAVHALKESYGDAGYGPGHRVGLVLENRAALFFHWLALNALGAGIVPLNHEATSGELLHALRLSEPQFLAMAPGLESAVAEAARQYADSLPEGTPYPTEAEIIFPFGSSYEFFDKGGVSVCGNGHGYTGGKVSIHAAYSDIPGYWEAMVKGHGEERAGDILAMNRHNTIIYPSLTIKCNIQAIRVVRPIAVDRTIIETHHFRLKGAPEEMFRRTILYSRLINSHGGMVGPDDLECYRRIQEGSLSEGAEWVDMQRFGGRTSDTDEPGVRRAIGTSDVSLRHQYQAWLGYMTSEGA